MRAVGDRDDTSLTEEIARALARELSDLGIHLDFAPCVDVDTNPANPVIGDRSFGRTPERVAKHAVHFITAMQEAGVAACAKHFPGHGDTSTDSHHELPRLDHDLERLRAVELPPFQAAIDADVASIMTAHVLFPALDPERPATVAPEVMSLLRNELGYEGVVFSDDLEMKAIADHCSTRELVEGCFAAGVDALLVSRSAELRDDVLAHTENLGDTRLAGAPARMSHLKRTFRPSASAQREHHPPYSGHETTARSIESARRHS